MDFLTKEKDSSDKKANILENNFYIFLKQIKQRIPIFHFLASKYKFHGEILEIGAGSCWLSALISSMPEVEKIYALDISQDLLDKIGEKVIKALKGDRNKIDFMVSDFSKTPFEDKKFDIIVCDAALHHAQNPDALLKEMNRILKDDGFLIAIREPVRSAFHDFHFMEFGKKEIEQGANENIYSKKEWRGHFNRAGFGLDIFEEFNKNDFKTKLFRLPFLKIFNGILFSRYYFFAKKSKYE